MPNEKSLSEIEKLLADLKRILVSEGERNWIRGVDVLIEKTQRHRCRKTELKGALMDLRETYEAMCSGNGSFSDYFIWRDNFDDRLKANENLDEVRDKIWELLAANAN